ncbi:hypothetical protein EV702DRAFT_1048474 [Suillus placidus]|uniref:Uncharacterized protein n=1 Tax=Suillus placidus TaxID=48579 RepID=A0A9P6ZN93_9AGAM|nr:hypothetical protein EV702DRAFT_1048474 [Suillus placidus]
MTQLLEYQDVLAAVLNRISKLQRSVAIMMQNDEQKDGEKKTRKKVEANPSRVGEVIRAQATRNTRNKRKVDDIDIDFNNDPRKENISPHHVPKQRALPPKAGVRIKCICREKTGTEWQSVLDVLKYDEEMHESRMIFCNSESESQ